jgi:hypothetical protein
MLTIGNFRDGSIMQQDYGMILGKLARPKQIHAAIDGSDPGMILVRLIEWMLQRPPAAAGAPVGPSLQLATRATRRSFFSSTAEELLEITEVQHA